MAHQPLVLLPASTSAAYHDAPLDGGTFRKDLVHLVSVVLVGDDDGGFGRLQTVTDVLGGEQGCSRHGHGARAQAAEQDLPPLIDPWEHDEDALARRDAEPGEHIGETPRALAQLSEAEAPRLAVGRDPEQRELRWVAGPDIESVEGPVEARRDFQPEVPHRRRVVGHIPRRHGTRTMPSISRRAVRRTVTRSAEGLPSRITTRASSGRTPE